MDKRHLILVLAILLVVAMFSGCVGNGKDDKDDKQECPDCNDNSECTTDYCSADTNYECRHDLVIPCCGNMVCELGETIENCKKDCATACQDNDDCNDGDKCTTDSCIDGVCVNPLTPGCEQKTAGAAIVSKLSITDPEVVEIYGENWDIGEWSITNKKGDVLIKFVKWTKMNGYIRVHSKGGVSTTMEKYIGVTDFWNDSGDTAYLKDKTGQVVHQLSK